MQHRRKPFMQPLGLLIENARDVYYGVKCGGDAQYQSRPGDCKDPRCGRFESEKVGETYLPQERLQIFKDWITVKTTG